MASLSSIPTGDLHLAVVELSLMGGETELPYIYHNWGKKNLTDHISSLFCNSDVCPLPNNVDFFDRFDVTLDSANNVRI